jgi:Tol biopolymer transport system component
MIKKFSPQILCVVIILTIILFQPVFTQDFGQNKVQYKSLNWHFIQTPHFDVYFTDGGQSLAEFTAKEAEKAYRFISEDFRWNLAEQDRISIITYKSHNDFEQTNVMTEPVDEATKGFTEFFKNRVVVPYQDSWEDFRHTIHHEVTHALTLWMLYGSGMMSVLQGLSRTSLPTWFIEGLAEYEAIFGMDTESEMYIRDLVVNNRLPDLQQLDYYGYVGVYKCGQSVIQFIADTYGKEKVGELLHQIRNSRDAGRAFKTALGVDWKELNRRWKKYVNRTQWPIGAETEQPVDFSEKITDHKEEEYNYYDVAPAISPQGDRLVYISNRSDYFDVYLYSLVENKLLKKLVSGERSKTFEELHVFQPGLSWSPDGKNIILASKAGGYDALSIIDVETAKVMRSVKFDFDGIYSPSWSPKGDEIAFAATKNGHCDIYVLNLNDNKLTKITDDIFSDLSPSWSPDGRYIAFASDRKDYLDPLFLPHDFDIFDFDYKNFDLYLADRQQNWKLTRITDTPDREQTPIFANDSVLFYVSDANGIYNIYRRSINNSETFPISNVITSCLQPSISRSGDKLAFISLYNFGYDIYLITDPLDPDLKKELKLTALKQELNTRSPIEVPEPFVSRTASSPQASLGRPYRNFVFDFRKRNITEEQPTAPTDTSTFRTESGEYVVSDYKIKFTADYLYASAYFSSVWGARGVALAHFSDILGNHNIFFLTDLQNRLEISNYLLGYQYLPWRVDFNLSLYHFVYYFSAPEYDPTTPWYRSYFQDRSYGISLSASYPLSKFTRFDAHEDYVGIDRNNWDENIEEYVSGEKRRMMISELDYVRDTSIGRYFGPINGARWELSLLYSPDLYPTNPITDNLQGIEFHSIITDLRKYYKAGFDYSFALRFTAGASFGKNPQRFFLGGVTNWINRPYNINVEESDIEDIYVSQFITPLRGGDFYERVGKSFFLSNMEFRFPFIQYLIFGWPIPYPFLNIRGALFSDFGAAWSDRFHFTRTGQGVTRLDDAIWGFGFGIRFPFPFIGWPTMWDVAWKSDLVATSHPRYYLSIGYEF